MWWTIATEHVLLERVIDRDVHVSIAIQVWLCNTAQSAAAAKTLCCQCVDFDATNNCHDRWNRAVTFDTFPGRRQQSISLWIQDTITTLLFLFFMYYQTSSVRTVSYNGCMKRIMTRCTLISWRHNDFTQRHYSQDITIFNRICSAITILHVKFIVILLRNFQMLASTMQMHR